MINILGSDNYGFYNVNLAQIIGLHGAVYCNELINIYKKAQAKNKLVDNDYIKVSRDYITKRTTLSVEEQLVVDANLMKINIIKKHNTNPDVIKLDIQLLASLIASDDIKLLDDIKDKVKSKSSKSTKESQRQRIINQLKEDITYTNYELLTAMRDWIDSIYAKPGGYLSKANVKYFEEALNNYTMCKDDPTKRDLDLALRLVKIATTQGYKDCQWAINVYEKDLSIMSHQQKNGVRTTIQEKADISKLSDEIF